MAYGKKTLIRVLEYFEMDQDEPAHIEDIVLAAFPEVRDGWEPLTLAEATERMEKYKLQVRVVINTLRRLEWDIISKKCGDPAMSAGFYRSSPKHCHLIYMWSGDRWNERSTLSPTAMCNRLKSA